MPTVQYVGHVSCKSFVEPYDRDACVARAKELFLAFVAEGGFAEICAVFEEGTESGNPHFHFYLESAKSPQSLRRLFEKHFRKGSEGQWMSLKKADSRKLDKYFQYLAKGVSGKADDPVIVVFDSTGRFRLVFCIVFIYSVAHIVYCFLQVAYGTSCMASSTRWRRLSPRPVGVELEVLGTSSSRRSWLVKARPPRTMCSRRSPSITCTSPRKDLTSLLSLVFSGLCIPWLMPLMPMLSSLTSVVTWFVDRILAKTVFLSCFFFYFSLSFFCHSLLFLCRHVQAWKPLCPYDGF